MPARPPKLNSLLQLNHFRINREAKLRNLCLEEKLAILNVDLATTLSKRFERVVKFKTKINSNSKEQKSSKICMLFYSIEPVENSRNFVTLDYF